ncbi:UNKNOWN [Stylonychia lemnae]|uniref:Uncharacterized protein n=1 Tax=Stylonychia lemnae TaxID=5949 RepID=A0A078AFP8_STYLE|nr:UNKNOWN [Stylonychia lemnae]|eukprot:CDW79733.1 UNKNOWN [Stylonychia lemnae]
MSTINEYQSNNKEIYEELRRNRSNLKDQVELVASLYDQIQEVHNSNIKQSIDNIGKNDICFLKSFTKPPITLLKSMEVVLILLDQIKNPDNPWLDIKIMVNDINFYQKLINIDVANLTIEKVDQVTNILQNELLTKDKLALISINLPMLMVQWAESVIYSFKVQNEQNLILNNHLKADQDLSRLIEIQDKQFLDD